MRIAVSNPDNIGDFILRQPLLAALADAGHELLLIVRDFVAPLAMDLFPSAKILQCVGNPYGRDFDLASPLGQGFLRQITDFRPEIFVVAAFQHTRLEELLAAALPEADCVGFTGHLFQARPEVVAVSGIRFATKVSVATETKELEKNSLLCAAVLGHSVKLGAPRMTAHSEGLAEARLRLAKLGLDGQRFWAVCAGDIADKSVKNWHGEQWAEFCRGLMARQAVHLLFIGSPEEHEATVAIQQAMGEAGLRTATITGEPTKLRALTGILALAEGYIGKDTGPMHIASALGKPVLAVFGGGHWPRFVPAARSGAVFTVNVPCTGCNWSCHLQRSHCVKDVPVGVMVDAAERLVQGGLADFTVTVLEPDRVLNASILRELWDSAQREHLKVDAERANFMQWHEDRLRDIAQLKEQVSEALRSRDELATQLAAESAAVQQAGGKVNELRAWQGELEARLYRAETGHAQMERERDEAAQRARAVEARLGEVAALEQRSRLLEERTSELELESRIVVNNLRQAREEGAAATEKLAHFRQAALRKIVAARSREKALLEENAELSARIGDPSRFQAELEGWQTKAEAAADEAEALRRRLEEQAVAAQALQLQLDTGESRLRGQVADLEQLISRKAEELASALELIPDLREELLQLTSDIDVRDRMVTTLEEQAAQRQQELEAVTAEKQELRAESVRLHAELQASEDDRAARLQVIEHLVEELETATEERAALAEQLATVQSQLEASDGDRQERLAVIERLSEELAVCEQDRAARLQVIEAVSAALQQSEADRAARLQVIEDLSLRLRNSETERAERVQLIEAISLRLAAVEKDSEDRLRLIQRISGELGTVEADRAERGQQIEVLHEHVRNLQAELSALRNLLPYRLLHSLRIM